MKSTYSEPYSNIRHTSLLKGCRWLLLWMMLSVWTPSAYARRSSLSESFTTGQAAWDSLIIKLNHKHQWIMKQGLGKLEIFADIEGYSCSQNPQWWTPFAHDLLPFEYRAGDTTYIQATCKASYQTPCDLRIVPITITSNNRRRSRRILKQIYPILFPLYSITVMRDKGDDKDYILPFSYDGLRNYVFSVSDTIVTESDTLVSIYFSPRKPHHELIEGNTVISLNSLSPTEMRIKGRIDFGIVYDTIRFDIVDGMSVMRDCSMDIYYNCGKMIGHNHFEYDIDIKQSLPATAFDPRLEKLDLTEIYQATPYQYQSWTGRIAQPDTMSATSEKDSIETEKRRKSRILNKIPQTIVSTTDFDALGADIRIYGPLNPTTFGYDKINGLTLRERVRFSRTFDKTGQRLRITPEIGFASRLKEFRYNFRTEWTYCPQRRGNLTLQLQNGTNGFSSRFKDDVNNTIKEYQEKLETENDIRLNFDSLGLSFFNRYEFTLDNSIEITNGLMFHIGATYSIRKPIKHGSHGSHRNNQDLTDATIENRYLDMNPYLRLVWTPRQYYYYDGKSKVYLHSQWPTFCFEVGKGVKNVLKSRTNYTRLEFDTHQNLRIDPYRHLSWRFGFGGFIKQDEEYFVNYTYFSRSKYPSTWDSRASGGAFALLDDYWFCSSPSYLQSHVMFESPFLLMHRWKHISKYIIKERLYLSQLVAQSKNPYGEIGYGIGNNYFNLSLFCGFMGKHPFDIGVKLSLELDQHL